MRPARFLLVLPLVFSLSLSTARIVDAQTLRGSRASVERIHRQALNHDLHFYETGAGVRRAVAAGRLVHLGGDRNYGVQGANYPYVLPATHTFVTRLATQYRSYCGEKLVVTSAVRPRSFRLLNSSEKSVHPTGMAVDLRKPARARCLTWLRTTLLALEATGTIEAVEERNPPHFHVVVFPRQYERYARGQGGEVTVAAERPRATASRAASPAGGATTYRVRKGDSLWEIARRHGTSVEQLKRTNNMKSSKIVAGQRIRIPSAK
jgi:hypothetical protein